MKVHLLMLPALVLLLAACPPDTTDERATMEERPGVIADEGPGQHLFYPAGSIEWRDGPPSFQPGAQFAVLEGDPGEAGVFTLRLRVPDGFQIAPHWHPNVERVTVISGTFNLGTGDEFNREATQPFPAGSYVSLPPRTNHFAVVTGETVVQLSTIGPWEINYVNPEDDPRRQN